MTAPKDRELSNWSRRAGRALRTAGLHLATAESCTGGLLAKVLTDIAGSSDYLERGWITYSNAAKRSELGVPEALLERHGGVSEEAAAAMARGALSGSGADLAVSITGIAGPGGAVPGKPVGTVWIAWARRHRGRVEILTGGFRFRGGRDAVRRHTVATALRGLLEWSRVADRRA